MTDSIKFRMGTFPLEAKASDDGAGIAFNVYSEDGLLNGPAYWVSNKEASDYASKGLGDIKFFILQFLKVEVHERRNDIWNFGRHLADLEVGKTEEIKPKEYRKLFGWTGLDVRRQPVLLNAFAQARGCKVFVQDDRALFERIDKDHILGNKK